MNDNHDGKTGQFSSGGGSGGKLHDRVNRFVKNAGNQDRHEWMGHGNQVRHKTPQEAHAAQDKNHSAADAHQNVGASGGGGNDPNRKKHHAPPVFGKRKAA